MSAALALTVVGCRKKSEEAAPPRGEACLITSENIDGKPYRSYEYDADGRLFRVVQYETKPSNRIEKRFSFDYDAKERVVAFRETNLLPPFINYQYMLHYSGAGLVDTIRKAQVFNSGPKLVESYALEYDAEQQLTKYKWADNYWRYEYDNAKNLTKWLARLPALAPIEGLLAEYGNYDGKKNIYYYSEPARLINLVSGGGASAQNPGSFKFYEASLTPTQTGVVTYQYNGKELPTEASLSLFSGSGATSTQIYTFTYDCQ